MSKEHEEHLFQVKQILEDSEFIDVMREVLIQEGKPCPFRHRKLKEPPKEREIWQLLIILSCSSAA